jgi:hypothetical protein
LLCSISGLQTAPGIYRLGSPPCRLRAATLETWR